MRGKDHKHGDTKTEKKTSAKPSKQAIQFPEFAYKLNDDTIFATFQRMILLNFQRWRSNCAGSAIVKVSSRRKVVDELYDFDLEWSSSPSSTECLTCVNRSDGSSVAR